MKKISLNLGELGALKKTLSETPLKKIDVPKDLRIPDWPSAAGTATVKLGKKEYLFLEISKTTGLFQMEKKTHRLEMTVRKNGAFAFSFAGISAPDSCRSDDGDATERIRALFIFHQFKSEICAKLSAAIEADKERHNAAVEQIERAMETFVPYLLADDFTSWEE